MLEKQTLDLYKMPINKNTIKTLKSMDKYKLFKFRLYGSNLKEHNLILRMLDIFPGIEIEHIKILSGNNIFDQLANKSMFRTAKNLESVLHFEPDKRKNSPETYRYVSSIDRVSRYDMRNYCEKTDFICIDEFNRDLNID